LPTVIETHLEGRYDFLVFLSFEISLTLIFYGLVLCYSWTANQPHLQTKNDKIISKWKNIL